MTMTILGIICGFFAAFCWFGVASAMIDKNPRIVVAAGKAAVVCTFWTVWFMFQS